MIWRGNKKKIAFILATAIFTGGILPSTNIVKAESFYNSFNELEDINLSVEQLEKVFEILDKMPEGILMSNDVNAIYNYLLENGIELKSNNYTSYGAWEIAKCVGAITWVIGSTVFAAAKIVKIRKYIKVIGGVKQAAIMLMGFYKTGVVPPDAGEKVGVALMNLASEILGIAAVRDNCF